MQGCFEVITRLRKFWIVRTIGQAFFIISRIQAFLTRLTVFKVANVAFDVMRVAQAIAFMLILAISGFPAYLDQTGNVIY